MEISVAPTVPGYVLQEKLGAGSYAVVYRAFAQALSPRGTRESAAIKCIERSKMKSKSAADNLIAEISILKNLRHPHIVLLRDFRWDANYIYLVMEFCSGGDLSGFIRKQRCLPEFLVKKFLQQLAGAMEYLRDRKISHMDLKPQNILLSSHDHPALKLADFGFAQHLREGIDDDDAKSLRGSPLYMAPEIFEKRKYDARVDLWSIGVILFECLFGRAPFASETYEQLVLKITRPGEVSIPDGKNLSDDCRNLLKALLRRDPNRRISFDDFFNHPFVDLDHAPSADSLAKAHSIVREAEAAENSGRSAAKAVRLYCRALEYFLPALQFTESPDAKSRLRAEIRRYVERAEALKEGLRPRANSLRSEKSLSEIDHLKRQWADTPQVAAAFTVISAAEEFESAEKFDAARQKYELAIASMLSLIKTEPPDAQRRQLLMNQVEKWVTRAECLKQFLDVQTVSLSKVEQDEQAIDAIEADEEKLLHEQQCTIQ